MFFLLAQWLWTSPVPKFQWTSWLYNRLQQLLLWGPASIWAEEALLLSLFFHRSAPLALLFTSYLLFYHWFRGNFFYIKFTLFKLLCPFNLLIGPRLITLLSLLLLVLSYSLFNLQRSQRFSENSDFRLGHSLDPSILINSCFMQNTMQRGIYYLTSTLSRFGALTSLPFLENNISRCFYFNIIDLAICLTFCPSVHMSQYFTSSSSFLKVTFSERIFLDTS